jgi:VanZ family protein
VSKRYLLATGLYCAFIWLLSSQSDPGDFELPFTFHGIDKIGHMILFGGLAAVVSVGLHRSKRPVTPWVQGFVPVLFATLYGVTDEFHQYFVPMRQFDIVDIMADMAGAVSVQCILCYLWWQKTNEKTPSPTLPIDEEGVLPPRAGGS